MADIFSAKCSEIVYFKKTSASDKMPSFEQNLDFCNKMLKPKCLRTTA